MKTATLFSQRISHGTFRVEDTLCPHMIDDEPTRIGYDREAPHTEVWVYRDVNDLYILQVLEEEDDIRDYRRLPVAAACGEWGEMLKAVKHLLAVHSLDHDDPDF